MIETIQAASAAIGALSTLFDALSDFIPKAVMFAAVIAAVAPPPDPASKFYPALSVLDRVVNYLAFNVGKAKNQRDAGGDQ